MLLVFLDSLPGWTYILIVPVMLILVLAIVALIIRIKNVLKLCNKGISKDDSSNTNRLIEAYGNKENIESVSIEMSRITVVVKDLDLVNPEAIKLLGASNVLISGNSVKSSFKEKSEEIYKEILEGISK